MSMSRSSLMDTADAFGGVLVRDDGKILLREPKGHYGVMCGLFPRDSSGIGGTGPRRDMRTLPTSTWSRRRRGLETSLRKR